MKSKTVKMISAVIALGVLCGAYAGVKTYVSSQEAKESEAEDKSETVTDISSDDVKSVAYTADQDNVELDKEDNGWVRKDETDFPLNQDSVDSAVNNAIQLTADQKITDVEDLSEYDLDSPQNEIKITTEDGTETVLQVGMENSSTSQYYVKKADDDKTVYLVSQSSLEPFMGSVYDNMAQSETFPTVTTATISDVKVDKEDGYELKQDPDDLFWTVSDDKNSEKADTSKAGEVTSAIGSMAYDKFVDYNCTDDSKYGFDNPYAVITAKYTEEETTEDTTDEKETADTSEDENADTTEVSGDSEKSADEESTEDNAVTVDKEITIYVGDETDGDRYVKVNDSDQVYTVTTDSLSAILDSNASDFYSMSVNYVSVNDLDSLEVQSADGTHTVNVTRETSKEEEDEDSEETTTTTYSLDGKDADETAFTTFYNKLINMTAQERAEDSKPEDDPAYTFTFTKTDGTTLTTEYYEYDTNFYAAVVEDKVYLVNKMNVRDMEDAYKELLGDDSGNAEDSEKETDTEADQTENTDSEETAE